MKPVPFDYLRPADMDATLAALVEAREAGRFAKLIGGGQSLGPMLNLRLSQPEILIDISRLDRLRQRKSDQDAITLGAATTHAEIEALEGSGPLETALREVAHGIAYRAVRCRGTIGGSMAHADPAADWVTVLATMDAELILRSPDGRRAVKASRFMSGAFAPDLLEIELVEAVRIPRWSAQARWGFYKVNRKPGEYAHAIGAVLLDPERRVARATFGAIEAPPLVIEDMKTLTDMSAAEALDRAYPDLAPERRRTYLVALRRALATAK